MLRGVAAGAARGDLPLAFPVVARRNTAQGRWLARLGEHQAQVRAWLVATRDPATSLNWTMLPLAWSAWSTTSTRPSRRRPRRYLLTEGWCRVGGSQHGTVFDYLLAPDADDGAPAHRAAVDRFQRAGRFLQADL